MSWGLRLALVSAFLVSPCFGQTGTVTFYLYGNTVKSEMAGTPAYSVRPFTGWLFDGPQRLVHARDGRYVTFRFAAGPHSFTAPLESEKPGNVAFLVNVEDGKHYCFHLYSKVTTNNALLSAQLDGKIEQVSCSDPAEGVGKLKPLETKQIDPAVVGAVDASTAPGSAKPQ
jgi:hypothetical protein